MRDKLATEEIKQLKVTQSQGYMLAPDAPVPPPAPDYPATTTTSGLSLHLLVQLTVSKRYDVSLKALDLQSLRYDPGTVDSRNSGAGERTEVTAWEGDLVMVTRDGLVLVLDTSQPSHFPLWTT